MKRILSLAVFIIILILGIGCKKFLSLDPPNALSGNNFWKSKVDAESFTNGLYGLLRTAVSRPNMRACVDGVSDQQSNEFPFFVFSGDLRGGLAVKAPKLAATNRRYIEQLAANDIKTMVNDHTNNAGGRDWSLYFNYKRFTQWDRFFQVIAAANIAYDRMGDVPGLSEEERKQYKAEAVFIRNMCYFLMVRQWGDVPYYTDAYHTAPLKRMPMVQVLQNCVADLNAVKNDLPWTYKDPVFVAVRAMRGSALALLMHMNMWLASFDEGNSSQYYTEVGKLGDELINENKGVYELLPLERNGEIFKGRSKEGLFEVPQNANYGESFGNSYFFDLVKYGKGISDGCFYSTNRLIADETQCPFITFDSKFMKAIYPVGEADKRTQFWFDASTMYNQGSDFKMNKFYPTIDPNAVDATFFDASQIIFRYSDAILLQAEAEAELNNESKALSLVNIVRNRAAAAPLTSTGENLKNDIFFERCRELIGEGHYWFDVVRTRRVIDPTYDFGYHCTVEQYKAGAWTWPIDKSALTNNPLMTLNNYWE